MPRLILALALVLSFAAALRADGTPPPPSALAAPCPPFVFAAEGAAKIIRYAPDGTVAWEYPAEMSRDVWQLPNGNVLFPYNKDYGKPDNPSGVMEVTPDRRVVFDFHTTGQVWSCQRLTDGNTLVGAASQGKLLIVSPQGAVVREIVVKNAPGHSCMRNARQIANGNFLVAEESAQAAREYSPAGVLLREFATSFPVYSAIRLPNGNTLTCGHLNVQEFDPAGKPVWALDAAEVPQLGIRWFAGLQVLPTGNLFVCNAGGKVSFFEITRDKRIVWQSNTEAAAIPFGHGIQRLDAAGLPLK